MDTATAIARKSWCREHQTDSEGEFCFAGFDWGPKRPDDGTPNGDVWASQQVATFGDIRVDEQPTVSVSSAPALSTSASKTSCRSGRRSTGCSTHSA